jgi:hypothetical protein
MHRIRGLEARETGFEKGLRGIEEQCREEFFPALLCCLLLLAVLLGDLAEVIAHDGQHDGVADQVFALGVDAAEEAPELPARRIEHA